MTRFSYGETVYWVDLELVGKVAWSHGLPSEGLPPNVELKFRVRRGVIVVEPDSDMDDQVTVYFNGDTRKRNPVELYKRPKEARDAAYAQLVRQFSVSEANDSFEGPGEDQPETGCGEGPNGETPWGSSKEDAFREHEWRCTLCGTLYFDSVDQCKVCQGTVERIGEEAKP